MTRNIAILAAGAVAVMLAGLFAATRLLAPSDQFASCRATSIAGGVGSIGGPFTLVSETGATVTEADVIDRPALVYFGYTFCPDVCPIDTARNAEAIAILDDANVEVKPVFITIDPERDTPEVLAEYTDYMHPRMIGLTGSEAQVKAAAQAYKAFYQKRQAPGDDHEFYLMDHSTQTYLMMPGHGFVEFFRRNQDAQQIADSIQCFVDAA